MNEPNWLDEDEAAAWINLLVIIELLPSALDAQLKRDFGITRFEYNVMAMLSESPEDTAPMSTVAALTNASPSRLTHAVAKLQARGLVLRVQSDLDKRSQLATLTREGRELVERAAPRHVDEARRAFFDAIPPEQVPALAKLLRPVARGLIGPDGPVLPHS